MAISFKGFIKQLTKAFSPAEYMNIETGEVMNRRSYNKLTKAEQQNTIKLKRTPIQLDRLFKQSLNQTSKESFSATSMSTSSLPSTRGSAIETSVGVKRGRPSNDIDKPKTNRTSTKKLRPPLAPAVRKKKQSVMPQKPPKKIVKQMEERMAEPAITVNNIDELKKRLQELERKAYPFFDVEAPKAMLLSIVENAEAYYENEIETYYNYLTENEETIAGLITDIEYRASDQDEFNNAVTNLATILNMSPLSVMETEALSEVLERTSYSE